MKILIDTGVFVSVLNKEGGHENSLGLLEKVRQGKMEGFISVMTIAEIISIFARLGEEETLVAKASIESLMGEDRIVPVTKQLAEAAGRIKADYGMSLADAFIIATALLIDCKCLATMDPEIRQVDGKLIGVKEPKELLLL